jgi:uncharacterized membrane protein (Fun14 family)
MILSNIFSPLLSEIGIGGVGGFVVGYTLKKVAKIVAIALGLGFFALQYLAYKGIITIDYITLRNWVVDLTGQTTGLQNILVDVITHIPFGASFALGLYLGIKKG